MTEARMTTWVCSTSDDIGAGISFKFMAPSQEFWKNKIHNKEMFLSIPNISNNWSTHMLVIPEQSFSAFKYYGILQGHWGL